MCVCLYFRIISNKYEFYGETFQSYMYIVLGKRKKGRRSSPKSKEAPKSNMKDECTSTGDPVVEKDHIQVAPNHYTPIYVLMCNG